MKDLDERGRGLSLTQTDVFESGKDGYHTYRIPALIVSRHGTVLAFCEGRKNSRADYGNIEIVLKRSPDNGTTWGAMRIVWDDGANTIGNPCPVVDRNTGMIWLLFCRNNDPVFVTKSSDDAQSWSTPVEITRDVKPSAWGWYATGPGHAVQLSGGRLLIPCDHKVGNAIYSHMIYSDDHGASWKLGGTVGPNTDECQVVETTAGLTSARLPPVAGAVARRIGAHSLRSARHAPNGRREPGTSCPT